MRSELSEVPLDASPVSRSVDSKLTQGYLICFAGTVVWSSTGIIIRYLTEFFRLPALVLAVWRDFLVFGAMGVVLALFAPSLMRIDKRHWKVLLLYGFILSLFNSLWTISVALNGAAVATVLAYSSAAFTAIFGWRFFSERLGVIKILAVLLSLVGCVFTAEAYDLSAWQLNPLGIFAGLSTGLAFAGYSLMGKATSQRGISSWSVMLYTFPIAAIFLMVYNFLAGGLPYGVASPNLFWLGSSLLGWGLLIFLAIGPTIGGYGLYTLSLDYLPASVANIIATLEPVITAALAFLLLGEHFDLPQWVGGALILLGVLVLRVQEKPDGNKKVQTNPPPVV